MASESRRLVILALVANAAIAVTKFIAAAISGSSAMLAEGIHSVADTGNQLFLLRGHSASRLKPDVHHPFGSGKELYFWAFMVAVFLFVGGGALSIYEGILKIRDPHGHGGEGLWFSLGVLAVAGVVEITVAFRPALKEFNKQRAGRSIRRTVHEAKDPSIIVVLFEDSAAVVGLLIAAAGIIISVLTKNAIWDGIASVLIGVLLTGVAWVIALEMKALLIGESASREDRSAIRAATYSVGAVHHVERILTMRLAPEQILVNMDVAFDDGLTDEELERAVVEIENTIRESVPSATRIFVEPVRS